MVSAETCGAEELPTRRGIYYQTPEYSVRMSGDELRELVHTLRRESVCNGLKYGS